MLFREPAAVCRQGSNRKGDFSMVNVSRIRRRCLVVWGFAVAITAAVAAWASPAVAASGSYAEAQMQVEKAGLTAEAHLLRQVELSRQLAGELPPTAMEKV